ncbi:hypothetical protein ACKWTF_011108 [Chironomus riparius]
MVVHKNRMDLKSFTLRALLVSSILSIILASPTTITAPPITKNTVTDEKDDLKQFLGHCLHKGNVSKCLKNRIVELIDEAITNNDEWSANFFSMKISLNKNPEFKELEPSADQSRTFEDVISQKLKSLMESRVVQVRLSDEDANNDAGKNSNEPNHPEARKKKDGKHGNHMMMMSGMAVMAMMIQLFLSKVAFLSGAALLIAKIALLFSTLSGLKKSGGSGGAEHVVYSADIAKQGWQRSIQSITPTIPQAQMPHTDEELAYRGHPAMTSYDGV